MQVTTNTNFTPGTLRLVIAGLIVISTLLFVVGVTIERSREVNGVQVTHQEASQESVTATPQQSGEASEGQGHVEGSTETTAPNAEASEASPNQESTDVHTERVLGIDIENPWVIAAFAIGWLALIVGLFVFGRAGLLAVMLAAIAALVFDIGEVALQFGRSDALVGAIAVVVAAAHAAIAVLSLWALARGYQRVIHSPK